MKNIAKALLSAQKQIENATKDAKNPHYKSKYATLESVLDSVKKIANDCGIVIVQGGNANSITTRLIHAESGEEITSSVDLVLDKQNMQGLGSAITYARRYSLAAMFAIGQDDDDGNAASIIAPPAKGVSLDPAKITNIPAKTKTQNFSKPETKPNFSAKPVAKSERAQEHDYPTEWDNFNGGGK